jgi:hypothetical protein
MKDYKIIELGNVRLSFAWYDLWIGLFVDKEKRKAYICLIPTLLLTIRY